MIKITLQLEPNVLEKRGEAVIDAVVTAVGKDMFKLAAHVVTEHLSGPPGLNKRSGMLAHTVRALHPDVTSAVVTGYVEAGGTGTAVETPKGIVNYARVQEYGGAGPFVIEPKNARVLAFEVGGKTVFAMRVNHPPLPERSFMRSSLSEMREQIVSDIQDAVAKALKEP